MPTRATAMADQDPATAAAVAARNRRTGLILAAIALAFFVSVIVRMTLAR